MDVSYRNSLIGLSALSWLLLVNQPTRRGMLKVQAERIQKKDPLAKVPKQSQKHPQGKIYKAYAYMVFSLWLQEIFINNLYKKDYELSSEIITKLTLVHYVTSGVVSLFIGAFADKYGLKSTNVMFTSCYGAAAFLAMVPELPVLFIGRVLTGIASAIMFSVLDAWIAQDFFTRKLINSGCDLYRTFGTLGVINAAAAVASSVVGDRLIWASGYNKAPLLLSGISMWQAMQLVWGKFREAYGASASEDQELIKNTPSLFNLYKRPYMWALTAAIMAFEGSSFLFAMTAAPVLSSVHRSKRELPLTYVFSCILAWALIGALTFNIAMVRRKLRFSRLMTIILAGANFVFYRLAKPRTERSTFWVMCFYGFLLGLYYPCMGTLKARLIEEGIRSTAFSLMRAPVYLFAVAMMLHQSVNGASTSQVYLASCALLTVAFGGVWMISLHKKIP